MNAWFMETSENMTDLVTSCWHQSLWRRLTAFVALQTMIEMEEEAVKAERQGILGRIKKKLNLLH